MSASENRDSDYITRVRIANRAIWEGINDLLELQRQWNALDYGSTLMPGVDVNDAIDATEVGAVVFDTANAMVTLLSSGHATNMAKLL